jgi:hypothetical protein
LETTGFTIDKEKALKRWKPILDSLNVTDEDKRLWMCEYAEMQKLIEEDKRNFNFPIKPGDDLVPPHEPGDPFDSSSLSQNLLPVAMKIAAQTIGMDLVTVNPMSSPKLGGVPELNEEKYLNERRKKILDDVFDDNSDDLNDDIKETDFKNLDEIKKDFMEGGSGLLFFDYKYGNPKNDDKSK